MAPAVLAPYARAAALMRAIHSRLNRACAACDVRMHSCPIWLQRPGGADDIAAANSYSPSSDLLMSRLPAVHALLSASYTSLFTPVDRCVDPTGLRRLPVQPYPLRRVGLPLLGDQ